MPADTDSTSPDYVERPPVNRPHATLAALAVVLVMAGLLRLPALTTAPPGLNQDEATNAWNAYCLLRTGSDQFGVRWPIFYMRALGENRSTLFCYVLLPFQAVGGLNVWTTRLPAAMGGILTVLLIYWVGARLFERGTGLAAAVLLAINPTHLQLSRWGHEASLTPLLTLAPLAALLWARLPLDDTSPHPRPLRAVLSGLLIGICCYGYPAVRLFLPVFLAGCALVTGRAWWRVIRTPRGVLAVAGLLVAVGLTFGPLAYVHVTEPEQIAYRGQTTWIWSETDSLATRLGKVADRYASHFGPEFLFRHGDADEIAWAAGFGFLPWYLLPLLVVGVTVCVRRLPRSPAARVLLAGVLLYPVADCLNWHFSLHALRSSAGLWPLILLAALGLGHVAAFLIRQRLRAWRLTAGVALASLIIPEGGCFLYSYFHDRAKQLPVYHGNQVDLLEACDWLGPHLDDVSAVICTTRDLNQPYLITLVARAYDPERWFAEPREIEAAGAWDRCVRYGKFHFLYDADRPRVLDELRANGRPDRVIFLLRASEPAPDQPTRHIIGPGGETALVIYDTRL